MRREILSNKAFCSGSTEGLNSSEKATSQELLDNVKKEWKLLWQNRVDDKVRAEGIANRDYSLLFIERGTVIAATRGFKPTNLSDILRLHGVQNPDKNFPANPSIGGWGKFARTVLNKQNRSQKWTKPVTRQERKKNWGPPKKGGRGWLHL